MTRDTPTRNGPKRNGQTGKPFARGGKPYQKPDRETGPRPERPAGKPARARAATPSNGERNTDKPFKKPFAKAAGGPARSSAGKPYEKRAPGKSFSNDRDGGARSMRRKPSAAAPSPAQSAHEGERIAKVIARAGLCSRRDAEIMIEAGRVSVNGRKLQSAAFNVTDEDRITIDGAPLAQRERTRLFVFHKPKGFVTTARDPEGRPTIFDALPDDLPRLVSVGRLDINTEGLLLLTNDGGLARVLELPETGWLRRYRVRAHGHADPAALDRLSDGVTIEGVEYRGIEARIERQQGDNVWIAMGLREGKNREIKRVLEHLGLAVNRLIRVSFGPFQLGDITEGQVEEIRTRILIDQLGEALAKEAGADFEAPVHDHKGNLTRDGDIVPHRPEPRASGRAAGGFKRADDARGGARAPFKSRDRQENDRGNDRTKNDRAPHGRDGGPRPHGRDGGPRPHGRDEQREPAPERPKDFRRKHVSVLREETSGDPRRLRTQSSEATDRRGREFKVERRMPAAGVKAATADAPVVRRDEKNDRRNARPERAGADFARGRPGKPRDAAGRDDRPPRREGRGPFKPRDGGGARPAFGERKPGPDFAKDRAQRPERAFERAERGPGSEKREFRKPRDGAGRDERAPRREGRAPFKTRDGARASGPARGRDGDRPPRGGKSFAGKPAGKPFADKPFAGKPRAPRRDGKPPASRRPPRELDPMDE